MFSPFWNVENERQIALNGMVAELAPAIPGWDFAITQVDAPPAQLLPFRPCLRSHHKILARINPDLKLYRQDNSLSKLYAFGNPYSQCILQTDVNADKYSFSKSKESRCCFSPTQLNFLKVFHRRLPVRIAEA